MVDPRKPQGACNVWDSCVHPRFSLDYARSFCHVTCWLSILIAVLCVTISLLTGNDWYESNSPFLVSYSKGSSMFCKRFIVLIVGGAV